MDHNRCRALLLSAALVGLFAGAPCAQADIILPEVDDEVLLANAPGAGWGTPLGTQFIINGLPPGSTFQGTLRLYNPSGFVSVPGGTLGGVADTFQYMATLDLTGTGAYAGIHRSLSLPAVQTQVHVGPRNPTVPVQSFPTDLFVLQGQLPPGDPDFDLLRITAGTGFGMPSPGHTTLRQLSGGNWAVDSFFDITYRIDFVGAPGGVLDGHSGTTVSTARLSPGQVVTAGNDHLSTVRAELRFGQENPIPAGFFDPGSEPFTGSILLIGYPPNPVGPLGNTDTIVRRLADGNLPFAGSTDPVPIELVQLSLVSLNPITVTTGGVDSFFDVFVELDPLRVSNGTMTLTRTNSGHFASFFDIWTELTFREVGNPGNSFVLNWGDVFGDAIALTQDGLAPWDHFPPFGALVPEAARDNYFFPQTDVSYSSPEFDIEFRLATAAIPEPGALSLVALGLLALARRRGRRT
ncbi:MAG TPA: hypothetical protein PLE19_02840 [Planctomycetota bacterium]|nr:hypothetical protein [Planctomycetota bacterium]HRR79957.1 hypothetical protein [Planctomycetota bacterium]HRT95749.1 hypothetical protein [Planctomycetota bacterium]